MTYNFDPEHWLETEIARIDRLHADGRLDDQEREAETRDAHRRYDEMVARLDGTYQIPPPRRDSHGDDE
jgi:hypothetical protein